MTSSGPAHWIRARAMVNCAASKFPTKTWNQGDSSMRLNINKALHAVMMAVGAVALGAIFVPDALAGCGDLPVVPGSALVNPANSQPSLYKPAVYRPTSESGSSND